MSKYSKIFEQLQTEFGDSFALTEDCLLVEEIPVEEIKTKGGLIVAKDLNGFGRQVDGLEVARANYVRVLKSGPGVSSDDSKLEEIVPGDVVTVGPNSTLWFSVVFNTITCSPRIGLTRASAALSIFRGDSTYEKIGARFKELVEAEVGTGVESPRGG